MCEQQLRVCDLNRYQEHLFREERAPATIENYLRNIRVFIVWLNGRGVTKALVIAWREHLLAQGQAPATVNAKLSALNSLFRFLGWEDCRVRFLKIQRKTFRDASRELCREEYGRLLAAARKDRRSWLGLLMETVCSTGIRVSEVRCVTVEAIRRGRANVALKGKIRTILFPDKLCRKLAKYAKRHKIVSGEIFRDRTGAGLSRGQIWRAMKTLCETARVAPSKVFPHNLRHLFATTFYRATRDIVRLADVLGHSSIETTRIYLLTTGDEHARQLERLGLVS